MKLRQGKDEQVMALNSKGFYTKFGCHHPTESLISLN